MKKWIGNLLILSSVILFIWLWAGNVQVQQQQEHIVEAFEAVKATGVSGESVIITTNKVANKQLKPALPPDVEGVLSIPSVELKAPVLKGASADNLNQGLGAINGMDEPGVVGGSYAIAGHRSHVLGEFFNRLDELRLGDQFSFETMKETIYFEVFNIEVVKPHEVDILKPQKGIALLSLITCYPENSNKYRLIVHGKRID